MARNGCGIPIPVVFPLLFVWRSSIPLPPNLSLFTYFLSGGALYPSPQNWLFSSFFSCLEELYTLPPKTYSFRCFFLSGGALSIPLPPKPALFELFFVWRSSIPLPPKLALFELFFYLEELYTPPPKTGSFRVFFFSSGGALYLSTQNWLFLVFSSCLEELYASPRENCLFLTVIEGATRQAMSCL